MTLLSGGVSQMGADSAVNYGNSTGNYYQPVSYGGLLSSGIAQFGTEMALSGGGYNYGNSYVPSYTVPVYQTPNYTYNYSNPTNVQYNPVQVSNTALDASAPSFNPVGPSALAETPAGIQIGHNTYSPQSLIASNPALSFAPGGTAARIPQYDTVSDASYGYSGTAMPSQPTTEPQAFQLNGTSADMPDMLPTPDVQNMGMPNPYKMPPQAPNYANSVPAQNIMAAPDMVMGAAPNREDYYPPAQAMARPSNLLARALWAMPGQARQRAGINAASEDRYGRDLNAYTQMMSTMMPGVIGANREMMQQMGADYRLNQQAHNQAALTTLSYMLDQEDKKIMTTAQSLDYLSKAFMLPPSVPGQDGRPVINRQKVALIRAAAPALGLNENDVYGLAHVQDMNAAQAQQQASIATRQKAFELSRMQQMLPHEIGLLKAHIAQAMAQANNLNADARTTNFNVRQRQAVAKYERWGIIANSFKAISDMLVAKGTRQATIDKAQLENQKIKTETLKNEMTARAIPEEAAAKLATAIATLSFNPGDSGSKQAGAMLLRTLEDALIPAQPAPPARPTRRVVPQLAAPSPTYFSGQPLSGNIPVAVAGE